MPCERGVIPIPTGAQSEEDGVSFNRCLGDRLS